VATRLLFSSQTWGDLLAPGGRKENKMTDNELVSEAKREHAEMLERMSTVYAILDNADVIESEIVWGDAVKAYQEEIGH
jgi:hypothetical protein